MKPAVANDELDDKIEDIVEFKLNQQMGMKMAKLQKQIKALKD